MSTEITECPAFSRTGRYKPVPEPASRNVPETSEFAHCCTIGNSLFRQNWNQCQCSYSGATSEYPNAGFKAGLPGLSPWCATACSICRRSLPFGLELINLLLELQRLGLIFDLLLLEENFKLLRRCHQSSAGINPLGQEPLHLRPHEQHKDD